VGIALITAITFAVSNAYFYYTIERPSASVNVAQSYEAKDTINPISLKEPSPIVTELQVTNSTQTIAFTFKATNTVNATLKSFQCSIDFSPFKECSSPVKLSLKELGEGEHTFEVRATDTDGNVEEQPAVHIWQ
jgi:hypothetical protein